MSIREISDLTTNHGARRAVLYARVSSKEQEQGYSILAQQELLRPYGALDHMDGHVVVEMLGGKHAPAIVRAQDQRFASPSAATTTMGVCWPRFWLSEARARTAEDSAA